MNNQQVQNFHNNQNYNVDGVHPLDYHKNIRPDQSLPEPFHIKTEEDDQLNWPNHHGYVDNENSLNSSNAPMAQSNQNMALDFYNNPLFYQNNFQSMFPLDFYGRHHQALANSFLSSYSNTNNPNLVVQQYLQQCTPQHMINNINTLKESNSNNHTNYTNLKKPENLPLNTSNVHHDPIENSNNLTFENSEKFPKTFHNGFDNKQMPNVCNVPKSDISVPESSVQYNSSNMSNSLFMNKNGNSVTSRVELHNGYIESEDIKSENEAKERTKTCKINSNQPSHLPHQPNASVDSSNTNSENDTKARYSCETCSYVCQSPAILKIHERIHSGEKPFSCSFCDYKSGQKNNVSKHVLVHMKKKPYRCQYCDYRCAQKNNLIVHERTHTGVKPFACTFCEYKTVQKPNLVKHMYLHTNEKPFACDMCDYRCVQKTNLTKHKQKHTLEKPFECTDCDYRSSQKSNLNKHQLIHVKGKTVQCDQCTYKCLHSEDLEKHKQSKHGVNKQEVPEDVPSLLRNSVHIYNNHADSSHYNMVNSGNIKCENSGVNF